MSKNKYILYYLMQKEARVIKYVEYFCLVGMWIAIFCLFGSQVFAQDTKSDLEVKMMPGITVLDGLGATANFLITSKTLDYFVTPALDLGLGSRALSVDQTGEDLTTHAGFGLCGFEKLICAAYVYDFQDQAQRVNVTVDVLSVLAMSRK